MNQLPAKAGTRSLSRNRHKDCLNTSAKMPAINDPAVAEGRTKFPNMVVPVEGRRVLKDGSNSCKTGNRITKGDWRALRIYTLSLEERRTCPVRCETWRSCYGNNTPFAERLKHGPDLQKAVEREVAELSAKHPDGFAIRLHVLGDFYSSEYVETWHRLFDRHRQLHAFGFSRRWGSDDPIDLALAKLKAAHPKRFRMRW
jgi:hypothetical protein